jgi:hypothetical protein
MSRRVYLLGVGLALLALVFLLTDALLWGPPVTEADARRIRPGMTLREVEAILGRPADVAARGTEVGMMARFWHHVPTGVVIVRFGPDRRVIRGGCLYVATPRPTPLARLRAWLDW